MLTRISNFGQASLNSSNMMNTQERIQQLTAQITSGKTAQRYREIPYDANKLVTLENELERIDQYRGNIDTVQRRLEFTETNVESMINGLQEFKADLLAAADGTIEPDDVLISERAQSLFADIASFLNTEQDGRYIFGGSKTKTQPVSSFQDTTEAIQTAVANGSFNLNVNNLAPDHLISASGSGTEGKPIRVMQVMDAFLGGERYGTLSGSEPIKINQSAVPDYTGNASGTPPSLLDWRGAGRIPSSQFPAAAGTFDVQLAGAANVGTVTVTAGDDASTVATAINNLGGVSAVVQYEQDGSESIHVTADDGSTVEFINDTTGMTFEDWTSTNPAVAADFSGFYYNGDSKVMSARIEDNTVIDYGMTADRTGFEKALLATWMVGDMNNDGTGGTALDSNGDTLDMDTRIDTAIQLLEDAISVATEDDLMNLRSEVGATMNRLQSADERHDALELYVEDVVTDIEDTDIATAATHLANARMILESSYMAISSVSQLSLANFLR